MTQTQRRPARPTRGRKAFTMSQKKVLAVLGGGGPAPGMNMVFASAALVAMDFGYEVIGIENGFRYLVKGDTSHVKRFTHDDLTRIHNNGGFVLGMSRENPTKSPELMANVIKSLKELGVTHLIGIGGDDTNTSLAKLSIAYPELSVVGIPKTIDNDIGLLPYPMPTFGYETARHLGDVLAQNYMDDAKTNDRWFFLTVMGRNAGFLSLGIGNSVSATVNIIPEEIPYGSPFKLVRDLLASAVIRRKAHGKDYGLALIAEGVLERIDPADVVSMQGAETDDHGHIRYSEIDFGGLLKHQVKGALAECGVDKFTVTTENLGYALRCNNPVGFDKEYCRKLGYSAVEFFESGGSDALVFIDQGGVHTAMFETALNEKGRIPVRTVPLDSVEYRMSLAYQFRLKKRDFTDPAALAHLAKTAGMTPEQFTKRFGYLVNLDGTGEDYAWTRHSFTA